MAERLDIVSQSNFPTNKSNTVEIVTTTKKKVTTASASDIATLVTPAISNLDIATQTNFPIQESDAQSDFIITTDGGVNNVTAEAAAGLISSYIPTGGGDPHKPDFTADYSENYSDFSNFTGSGTEADPYQIWDEEMFLNARFKVNNGGLSSATYFKQMRDIVWQFDGYGWGTYLKNINARDANNQVLETKSYGSDTLQQYINYDGGNWTLYVHNKGFTLTNDIIANIVNFDVEYDNLYYMYSAINIAIFSVNNISNIRIKLVGDPIKNTIYHTFKVISIGDSNTTSVNGKAYKCIIEDFIINDESSTVFYAFYSYIEGGIDTCTAKRIGALTTARPYAFFNGFLSSTAIGIKNSILDNDYLRVAQFQSSAIIKNCICKRADCTGFQASSIIGCTVEDLIYNQNNYFTIFYITQKNGVVKNCILTGNIDCTQNQNLTDGGFYAAGYNSNSGSWYVTNFKNTSIFNVNSNGFTYDATRHALLKPSPAATTSNVEDDGIFTHDA